MLIFGYRLIRRFNHVVDTDFINKQRIDYAAQLMKLNRDLPIAEVTIRSGFTSTSAFYRNFKLYKGCSPRDYRK